ncbi:RNA-guided endonuclease InsQ/TnpB family protein [Methanohalophilus profundi]|uniref:RNA-guided endonuclease InsQ/TnpB family protein n=1 Tax=Methanohalophilus profundi TaxID=2138083 RepID=UPI00101DCD1B|nr:RNA-guided endonuclease TnpB family protein [Methanohalophilus profundi]
MILTYKLKHNKDFSDELRKAKQVAEFGVKNRTLSSKDVKHFGLKSAISNQILRKYVKNKKVKSVRSVQLTVPNQSIKVDKKNRKITIPCLKLVLNYQFPDFEEINQIEIGKEYACISVTIPGGNEYEPEHWIGVDRNTTGHVVVAGEPDSGKVIKLGKHAQHTHTKYKNIRKRLQKRGKHKKVKQIKNRESRIVRDLNHKMSRKIVDTAKSNNSGIKLENLKGIRKNRKHAKSFKYSLNSWSFYQLQTMIEYKAKLLGVPISYIDPAYTSQKCSRCGHIGDRNGKQFECPACGHVDHADVNAAFNIALSPYMSQSSAESDVLEGSTDTPEVAMA